MTTAWDVLLEVYRHGSVLTPTEDGGVAVGGAQLTRSLRARLESNRTEIAGLLREHHIGERNDFPSPLPRRFVVPSTCRVPDVCCRLGPCGPPGTCQRCGVTEESSTASMTQRKDAA